MKNVVLLIAILLISCGLGYSQIKEDKKDKHDPSDVIFSMGLEDTQLLIDLTYSDNFRIAQKAVYRLGQIKATNAFYRLISIFLTFGTFVQKGFEDVILASVWSLGEIGDKRALDPLIDNYNRFNSVPYRIETIRAVSKLGKDSDKAFVFLDTIIRTTDNNMIAFEVVKAFKNIGKIEAIKTLSEVLKSGKFEKWVNLEIENAIVYLGGAKKEK
ncbi:MAG: hypothetical protein N2712_03370 [Brevinematales bacterium]|nr:hypothetical protein [Brevinematales bacterium]